MPPTSKDDYPIKEFRRYKPALTNYYMYLTRVIASQIQMLGRIPEEDEAVLEEDDLAIE